MDSGRPSGHTLAAATVGDSTVRSGHAGGQVDLSLKLEEILLRQFDYATRIAQVVREDLSRTLYLYFVMVGVFVAGLGFLLQFGRNSTGGFNATAVAEVPQTLALVTSLAAGLLHAAFFVRFVRLRRRLQECHRYIGQITDYYIARVQAEGPRVEQILRWRPEALGVVVPAQSALFSAYSLLAVFASISFATVAGIVGELWLGANRGNVLPLPESVPLYAAAAAVFVLSLVAFIVYDRVDIHMNLGSGI